MHLLHIHPFSSAISGLPPWRKGCVFQDLVGKNGACFSANRRIVIRSFYNEDEPAWGPVCGQPARSPFPVACEGVVGKGRSFFKKTIAAGHEGVLAKRLTSRYVANRRTCAWQIKPKIPLP